MKRLALIALVVCGVSAGIAEAAPIPQPKTVAQFHRLPEKQRRQFALNFMTTHPVDPCTLAKTPLSQEVALNVLTPVADDVKPGHDAADEGTIPGRAPVGYGIRRVLANIGC